MNGDKPIHSFNDFNEFIGGHSATPSHWDATTSAKLYSYCQELLKWNKKIRLTAAKDLDDLSRNHISDALHLIEDIPKKSTSALDVGSGGGLPVIPFAIATPNISWTSLEAIAKKSAFLNHIKRVLELKNFTSLNIRFEDYAAKNIQHDVSVARAVWPPDVWLEKAKTVTRKSGTILILEASNLLTQKDDVNRRHYKVNGKKRSVVRVLNNQH